MRWLVEILTTAPLRRLASDGYRLLLQVHDFAEDLRPLNFGRLSQATQVDTASYPYPDAAHIHYGQRVGRLGISERVDVFQPWQYSQAQETIQTPPGTDVAMSSTNGMS